MGFAAKMCGPNVMNLLWGLKMLDKSALREKNLHQRKMLNSIQRVSDAALLLAQFVMSIRSHSLLTIGGYWSVGSEIATHDLLEHCHNAGHTVALPTRALNNDEEASDKDMSFRTWTPRASMTVGSFNVPEPDGAVVLPSLLLVPLLAFDRDGGRLGRGGGYYDIYLSQRRQNSDVCALGLAFSFQEVENCPMDAHDERLDAIMTPRDIHWINKAAFAKIGVDI